MAEKERVTITIPAESAAALRRLAKEKRIESVSAYVTEAVEERLGREERAQRIIEGWAAEVERAGVEEWAEAVEWARASDRRGDAGGAAA
ncbi:ribbon-helix-helix protein, CopG family [Streptomyces chryseus]